MKMNRSVLLLTFAVLFVVSYLPAQDEAFSAYRFAALAQSPAEAGRIETQSQLSVLYRTQWNNVAEGGYQSAFAGFESQLFCPGESFFGLGISAAYETAGTSHFTRVNGNITLAYHQKLADKLFLSGGGEVGVLSYQLDQDNLRFDAQFNGISYDPSLPSLENFSRASSVKIDAAVGALLYQQEGRFSVGFSVNHLTAPTLSFLEDGGFTVGLSSTVYGNFSIPIEKGGLVSNVLNVHLLHKNYGFVENKQWFIISGIDFLIPLGSRGGNNAVTDHFDIDLSARIAGRESVFLISDAIIATARFSVNGWQFGAAYDFNISPLSTATNSFGALEGFLTFPLSKASRCVRCPRF